MWEEVFEDNIAPKAVRSRDQRMHSHSRPHRRFHAITVVCGAVAGARVTVVAMPGTDVAYQTRRHAAHTTATSSHAP